MTFTGARGREKDLVRRHRRGDPGAFEEVVRDHGRAVYDLARRFTGDHAAADEATQETLIRAWRSLDRFRGESSIRTWIFGIALNVMRSAARGRVATTDPAVLGGLAAAGIPADEVVAAARERDEIRRAVEALPPRQREVVVLKALTEMTYDEVARVMGLTVGAVKAHFHQAVRNLRRLLESGAGRTR